MKFSSVCLIGIVAALLGGPLHAQDGTITYQGQLRQTGQPFTGTANLEFRLFTQLSGGSQVGSTLNRSNWPVEDGLFQVELDFGLDAFTSQVRYLEVRVDGSPLTPRQAVRPSPMALFALAGNEGPAGPQGAQGLPGDSHWQINGTATYYASGNVGIGTTSPAWPLDIVAGQGVGKFTSTASSNGSVIELRNDTPSASSIGAINFVNDQGQFKGQIAYTGTDNLTFRTGGAEHVRVAADGNVGIGTASPSNPLHVVSSGLQAAIRGQSDIVGAGVGVWGISNGSGGTGVSGLANANSGTTTGVSGWTESPNGTGVRGWANGASGPTFGVRGETPSPSGTGVYGRTWNTTGTNYGVWGQSASPSGFDFFAAGAGTNYGAASSRRWKHSVEPIPDPLEMMASLRGVYFDWDEEHGGQRDIGMIAEEVGAVVPEIVQYEEDGVDAIGMDYGKLSPLLVAAVNALRAEKDQQIAQLEARIAALEARLAAQSQPGGETP